MCLPAFVLLEQLDRNYRRFDEAGGAVVFRRLGDDAFVRNIEGCAFDPDDRRFEIDILPLQTTQLFTAHTGEHEQLDHRAVLHILAVEQGKQAGGLFFVQIARTSFLFLRERRTLTRIARYQLPLDRYPEDGRQEGMVMPDGIVGERYVFAVSCKGFRDGELQRLAYRACVFLADTPAAQRITQGRRGHAGDPGKLLGRIAAIFEEFFEVDMAFVMDLPADAFPELVAVKHGDFLRRDPVDADVPELLRYDLCHPAIALDGFLLQIQLGVRLV